MKDLDNTVNWALSKLEETVELLNCALDTASKLPKSGRLQQQLRASQYSTFEALRKLARADEMAAKWREE